MAAFFATSLAWQISNSWAEPTERGRRQHRTAQDPFSLGDEVRQSEWTSSIPVSKEGSEIMGSDCLYAPMMGSHPFLAT